MQQDKNIRWRHRCWLALALLVLIGPMLSGRAAASLSAAPPAPRLRLLAPRHVPLGAPITLTLTLQHAVDVAGYETLVLFDPAAAQFAGVRHRRNDVHQSGRGVSPLAVPELASGSAVGFFPCATADCLTPTSPRNPRGAQGTVRLGTVELLGLQPGVLEIQITATKFVDAQGRPISVADAQQVLRIRVGDSLGNAVYAAPASPWTLPTVTPIVPSPADLTGDGAITYADALEVAVEWTLARERGAPCGPSITPSSDLNRDGCVDVADIQLAAQHTGQVPPRTTDATSLQAASAPASALALTSAAFTVNVVSDGVDARIGDGICATASGYCTLRAAIAEANAHPGADTIQFNIPGGGLKTIQLSGRLPTLSDASGPTTIDGYTQPGAVPNTESLISNALIRVQIVGKGERVFDGLTITAPGNVIRGLAFYKLRRALWLYASAAQNNQVLGCFIGTDATGVYVAPATDVNGHGLHIEQGASANRIGGVANAMRNVISGNPRHGIGLWHEATDNNVLVNNLIGLAPTGTTRVPNLKHGVDFNYGAAHNRLGGTASGERNVIAGNDDNGVEVSHTAGTTGSLIAGNYIGTDVSGTQAPAFSYNGGWGILLEDRVTNNGFVSNVIGNNRKGGVRIDNYPSSPSCCTTNNWLERNRIGIGVDGSAVPNNGPGIVIFTRQTRIGPGNIIAHNLQGIKVQGDDADANTITRNAIFNNGGPGIDLTPQGAVNPNDENDRDTGPNEQLNFPKLTAATRDAVHGTACPGCTVEVFVADKGEGVYGSGKTFVGAAPTGADGRFVVAVAGVLRGDAVTATATDAAGNTSEFARNILVTAALPVTYVQDRFERSTSDGWGRAEIGGAYTHSASATSYATTGAAGTITHLTSGSRSSILPAVSAVNVDATVRGAVDQAATGNGHSALVITRRINSSSEYRSRIRYASTGSLFLQAVRVVNGQQASLGTEVQLPGITYTPGRVLWIRTRVVGTNPTTIRIKAWPEGTLEPAGWQYSVTDGHASLQVAGAVGLMSSVLTLSSGTTVVFSLDDLTVVEAPGP